MEACGANASTQAKRSDFNMGNNAPFASDEVTPIIVVETVNKPAR